MAAKKYTKKHHKGKKHQKHTKKHRGGGNENSSYSNKYNTITANNANVIYNNANSNNFNNMNNLNNANNAPQNNIYTAQEILDHLQRHIKLYGKNTPIRTEKDGIFGQVYGISYDDENNAITIEI